MTTILSTEAIKGVLLALLDPGPETSWPVSVCLPARLSQLGWESGLEPTEIRIYDFSRGFQKRTTTLTQNEEIFPVGGSGSELLT
ncbi:unnamed protein product [Boreogadus saida]